ncbi:protein tramtrack, beta isoform-like isoform X3 [Varroa destructor]|uniref:Uncharacterized protein n=2 Tax=Varroa TaxID=62624 RepID=A0A7M7MHE6_VARDE|nr:protein tramtrack, beta isoform-like isoform X3 [Varroa destructor]
MGSNAQQFCLKWNNHQANMLSVFDRLLSNKSLVDVTIGCEGRQVKAHKVVLSACSPFFENLFTENPCKHPIVILKDIRYADLKALVEFMYKGEVNVVQEQLPTLLKTAEALKIKGLAEVTGEGKSEDKPHASVTPRPESPGSRRKRQRVRRKSTDSAGGHSDSEESVPKASRTEHDDSSMDGATSLDDGSQASLQHSQTPSQASGQARGEKETSNVQSNAATVNNSSSSAPANNGNSTTNGPNSSSKDADFEPTRLLEASMTTDHGTDNSTDMNNSTGPDNPLIPDGLDIKPIITLEEGATPTGAIVPASAATSLPTGTDAISSLFPQGTGATALPGTSYQASPQSHGTQADVVTVAAATAVAGSAALRLSIARLADEELETMEIPVDPPLDLAVAIGSGDNCNAVYHAIAQCFRKDERCFVCCYCTNSYSQLTQLLLHLQMHPGRRPYRCHACGQAYKTWNNLDSHRMMTHERGLYTCDKCSYKTQWGSEFSFHVDNEC